MKTGPPLPTVTVTVAALPTVGLKARTATIMPTNTAKQRKEIVIASISFSNSRCRVQYWKSDAIVTFCRPSKRQRPLCGRLPALDLKTRLNSGSLVTLPAVYNDAGM